ncbi:MAG: RHS repeat-associated core domain-containing protein, partial [Oligoflexales bacterium]
RYGNRTGVSKSGSGAGSIPLDGLASLVYTNAQSQTVSNRITTAGYEYDPAGNQTRGEISSGVWRRNKFDSAGRLAVVTDDGGSPLETYSYGASNERLLTVYGNNLGAPATYYCWEGGQVIADFRAGTSSNLVWEKSYVYLGGRLLATADISGTKYHHPDRLGTRLITDTSGNVTTEQVNLPYGTALTTESSGAISNRRFTSYDRSATTGMDYAINRFYNSAQGRFTQVDPIGMAAASLEDPQTLNLYGYCGNDPVNHVDPDGLFFKKLFGWVGKAFKFLFKVAAIALFVVAMVLLPTMIAAGGFWLASGAWFGWGSWAGLMGAAGLAGLAGWHNGKLGDFAGAFLGTLGKGGNFRTPSINPGAIEQYFQRGGRGTGGGGRGRGTGGGGRGGYNGPPRSRLEAWARIIRGIFSPRPPRPINIPNGRLIFRGLIRNRPLRELSDNEIYNAFRDTGYTPTSHFIMRLRHHRTQELGVNTLNDFARHFNLGEAGFANMGRISISHGNFETIVEVTATQRVLVTFTPR